MSENPNEADSERLDLQVQATNRLIEALAASEQTMRRRIELISDVVFELDRDERVVFANRAWTAVVGERRMQPSARALRTIWPSPATGASTRSWRPIRTRRAARGRWR